jgi:uncharacterized protein
LSLSDISLSAVIKSTTVSPVTPSKPFNVGVIGSGISGLGCAHRLSSWAKVTVFEQNATLGGHSNAIDVQLDGLNHPVDTGFLVFNDRTYPNLLTLFAQLNVPQAQTDMSFAVSLGPYKYEWCGSDQLSKALAQPSNLLRPRFWLMLRDMLRFNKAATQMARAGTDQKDLQTGLGTYLDQYRYSNAFKQDYLLPMAAAIWSCPIAEILAFPMSTFVRFCDNHGLLQINNRPRWRTVNGSSRVYVKAIATAIQTNGGQLHVNNAVKKVTLRASRPTVHTENESLEFDAVVFASHSDQTLAMLPPEASSAAALLKNIRYTPNKAYLHTDLKLMPQRKRAWAAWNYLATEVQNQHRDVSVTYWLNQLQPLPFKTDVFVTLNPIFAPGKSHVLGEFDYMHPVFDAAAVAAQAQLPTIQGEHRLWYAGAWAKYGFHEDGLTAGLNAADAVELFAQSIAPGSEALAA